MVTSKIDYQNGFRGIEVPILLSTSLPSLINRLFIILSLKVLLTFAKLESL